MKYIYAYKSSDGTRHEASMDAESREAVFQSLRRQGIKAIKVIATDGSRANGEIRGVRIRIVAILVGIVAAGVGAAAYLGGSHSRTTKAFEPVNVSPRHQIYGDPALIERFESGDFGEALTNTGDRLLAWYAQPGKIMCPKSVNPRRMSMTYMQLFDNYTANQLGEEYDLVVSDIDSREIVELKQIVNGIRQELREYLANGNGTARSFWRRLIERTMNEAQIFERTLHELANETSSAVWDEKNEQLRRLGLRTIPNASDEN